MKRVHWQPLHRLNTCIWLDICILRSLSIHPPKLWTCFELTCRVCKWIKDIMFKLNHLEWSFIKYNRWIIYLVHAARLPRLLLSRKYPETRFLFFEWLHETTIDVSLISVALGLRGLLQDSENRIITCLRQGLNRYLTYSRCLCFTILGALTLMILNSV